MSDFSFPTTDLERREMQVRIHLYTQGLDQAAEFRSVAYAVE